MVGGAIVTLGGRRKKQQQQEENHVGGTMEVAASDVEQGPSTVSGSRLFVSVSPGFDKWVIDLIDILEKPQC